ncbi:metal ABC transporter solute-binding protein, Zn/Mn family [Acetobacterium woodii]|uniref:Zinc ABC transport system zinc-binding protein ZnuA n=1 Tax=Acetobacterium woodii (strain ATCC 29683 / DSM 1030 / JCM 2381 / KCTC 1655 / WB1) TaxID=931626 RepID=H6LDX5_ACEWD|nr:zinc ABC transporter substrate-binding protein [Acetobacterium woodii]AFA48018.1 zinc ABC transport system zinc-binding protein ZnuA [Acetobacterium woodii DSM 1030]
MKRIVSVMMIGLILTVGVMLSATACSSDAKVQSNGDNKKTVIAVTIVPEQTFVEAVCGDLAEVVTLVPPGNSPENYEPTPQEMEKFSQASLYFTIGVPTEEANILPNVGDLKVVSLQDAVKAVYPERLFESGERDPHIWLSPKRVEVMVKTIAQEMSTLDPDNQATYEKNAEAYIAQLNELDQNIKTVLAPVQNKKFIVYHPAFGYLADDYGLKMIALEEEGKEATPQQLQSIIDLAKADNIKAIFYQEEIDSSQSQAFAEELGGKTIQLAPLAANYIENLQNMANTMAEVMK